MAEINASNVAVWTQRFRRLYPPSKLADLVALADQFAAEAGDVITFTQSSMEGASGVGVVTGNKMEMVAAAEAVIAEIDPTTPRARLGGSVMRFSPC